MIKARTTALILGIFLLVGSAAMAQTDQHDVTIRIPDLLSVRIVDGSGNNPSSAAVVFDFQANATTYINTVNAGGGEMNPTGVTGFADVLVLSNHGSWKLNVSAAALGYSDNQSVGTGGTAGIALSDIKVHPSGGLGTGVTSHADFDLSTATAVAVGIKTTGWSGVGISGDDYRLAINGDENPGEYTTVVTYSITSN